MTHRVTIPRPPGREEWLAARFPYVGASESAALVGAHPFLTLGDLAARKLRLAPPEDENRAMIRGNRLEAAIAEWYSAELGLALEEPDVLYVADDVLIATLDRRVVGTRIGVEVKTSSSYVNVTEPPTYWIYQAQAQMVCADLDGVEFAVLDASMDLKTFSVAPDLELQTTILELAAKFCAHVRAGEMPPDAELSYETVSAIHPRALIERVDLDAETIDLVDELRAMTERRKSAERSEDNLKSLIARALGDAAEGFYDGRLVVTWREQTSHRVDVARLKIDHPNLAGEYTVSTTARYLRLKS